MVLLKKQIKMKNKKPTKEELKNIVKERRKEIRDKKLIKKSKP